MEEANKFFTPVSRFVNQTMSLQDCIQLIDITKNQLDSSISLLKHHNLKSFTLEQAGNLQIWLSTSNTNHNTYFDKISEYPKNIAKALVESSVHNVRKLINNSLAIGKAAYESKPDSSPELRLPFDSIKDGFPSWLPEGYRRLL